MAKRVRESQPSRVKLNVGGKIFLTSLDTLTMNSTFFQSRFSRWGNGEHAEDEEVWIDRDADAFQILLSCMRSRSAMLPSDLLLCESVLRDAEFYGVDWLTTEVKVSAMQRIHPGAKELHTTGAFDSKYGGFTPALNAGILPRCCVGPPFPRIKQVIPAQSPAEVLFVRTQMTDQDFATRPVVCYSLLEEANGSTHIEPMIARQRPDVRTVKGADDSEQPTWKDECDWCEDDASQCDLGQQVVSATVWANSQIIDHWELHTCGREDSK